MTTENAQQLVAKWALAGAAMSEVARRELREFSHQLEATKIDDLLAAGMVNAQPRTTSGLVEMQRILSRARH